MDEFWKYVEAAAFLSLPAAAALYAMDGILYEIRLIRDAARRPGKRKTKRDNRRKTV